METQRLYLRERTAALVHEVLTCTVQQQLDFFGFDSEAQLKQEYLRMAKRAANTTILHKQWDLLEKETGKVAGSCGFHNWLHEHQRAELGYFLNEAFRGKGYMLEALQAIVAYGFESMKLQRIEAFISPDNLASQRLVSTLMFTQEGLLRSHHHSRGKRYDSLVFSILESENR
jgi:ribosomal-protein-alanine N-acetyltransferase